MICWMVWLMYQSYAFSWGLRGGRAIGTFIPAVILAEILSKGAIYAMVASLMPAPLVDRR